MDTAQQTVIGSINRPEITASLIIAGLTFASGIKVLSVKTAHRANADLLLPGVAGFVVGGAKAFGIIGISRNRAVVCIGIRTFFSAEIMGSGAVRTAVRIESGVAGTFIFTAAGIRTEGLWIKTFAALKTVIPVTASIGQIGIVRAYSARDIISGTNRDGRLKTSGIAFSGIVNIIRLVNIVKTYFIRLVDDKMHFSELNGMRKGRPGWKQPGERRLN